MLKRKLADPDPVHQMVKISQHRKFHNALWKSDLRKVVKFIKNGITLCHRKDDNCFILAQDNVNPEFLKVLLEYDPTGVNSVDDSDGGDSLLIRDILDFECRHFKLLTDIKQLDVNYTSEWSFDKYVECTAFHCATMVKETPIHVIQKLIELGSDINKELDYDEQEDNDNELKLWGISSSSSEEEDTEDNQQEGDEKDSSRSYKMGDGDTPLILLLKNYDTINGFEKVKLLIESGADVNLQNKEGNTPLMIVTSNKICDGGDLKLMKYLINNGANASICNNQRANAITILLTPLLSTTVLSAEDTAKLISEYYFPAIDLLIGAGGDIFLNSNEFCSPIQMLLNSIFTLKLNCNIQDLILRIIELGFEKLTDDINFKINEKYQTHPLKCILQYLNYIVEDKYLFLNIIEMVINHPTNEFKNVIINRQNILHYPTLSYLIDHGTHPVTYINNISTVGAFLSVIPLNKIKKWLVIFHENNFDNNRKDPLYFILLRRFIHENPKYLIKIFDYLIEQLYQVDDLSSAVMLTFPNQNPLKIPDCIKFSAENGNIECLMKFLPYWNQTPLATLLFIRPWTYHREKEQEILLCIAKHLLPFLYIYDGPLSHGTKLYNAMKIYIRNYKIKGEGGNIVNEFQFHYDRDSYIEAIYQAIADYLTDLHGSPASLKVLCRTVIRANAIGNGNNLPNYLASLVPYGLKKFISCDFN